MKSRHTTFTLLAFLLLVSCSHAQKPATKNRTANDAVTPYSGLFRYGSNMGYYPPYSDEQLAEIAEKVGVNSLRPAMFEHFVEYWGYDIRKKAFAAYGELGMTENVCFIGYPSEAHRDKTVYCGKDTSQLFKNLYLPIWDKGENGTPINEENYYAIYVYKLVKTYQQNVKFWEIWNEPDYAFNYNNMLPAGQVGSWWSQDPAPCDYSIHAPIQHYIRMLRISYEVIKSIDKDAFVTVGGIGFPSFLDAILRQSDNPDGGKITPEYPLKGGAYFDVLSYHTYPHIDNSMREWSNQIQGFVHFRHSDRGVEGIFRLQREFDAVLKKYGYDNKQFPEKHYLITECNIPAKPFGEFIGSYEAQRNFLIKALIECQKHGILQFHVYSLGELQEGNEGKSEFDYMGLYQKLTGKNVFTSKTTESGIAYHTTSKLLSGYKYDSILTKKLALPTTVKGAAFVAKDTVFCLWAVTTKDRSEAAEAVYSLPKALNINYLQGYDWNFSQTAESNTMSSQYLKLSGTPLFFRTATSPDFKNSPNEAVLYCYPNPANTEFFINYQVKGVKETKVTLSLYSVGSRMTQQLLTQQPTPEGRHQWRCPIGDLQNGLYIVQLSLNGRLFTQKVSIKHE